MQNMMMMRGHYNPYYIPSGSRVLVNGCWDLLHTGHYNALRQVKEKLPKDSFLIAGIHSLNEIQRVKGGAFLLSDKDKVTMLRACKFVDDIIENVPYTRMTPSLLDSLGINYTAHGDDIPILPDGTIMYHAVQQAGRYLNFPRSEGISTTNLINRILSKTLLNKSEAEDEYGFNVSIERFASFSNFPRKKIGDCHNVVYIDGAFDLFTTDHLRLLEIAKSYGDFLLVGIHSDSLVEKFYPPQGNRNPYTIMTTGERALNLLSCKHVDDVLLSAPFSPTPDFLATFGIKTICLVSNQHSDFLHHKENRFSQIEKFVKLEQVELPERLSTQSLLELFQLNVDQFIQRNTKKKDPSLSDLRLPKF